MLIGDNGQADRQIYYNITTRYSDRIAGVSIRVAREKAQPFNADYLGLGIPYFEFEDGFSLQQQLLQNNVLHIP